MHRPALVPCYILTGHFRIYRALVDGQYRVICLESDCYPGIYVSWDTDSESIKFFVSLNLINCLQ